MLSLKNIDKTFNKGQIDENQLFQGLDVRVAEGDFICVLGSNGAGKSSLLNIISGKLGIDRGSIVLEGEHIEGRDKYIRCKKISRIFQNPSMGTNPDMTVFENLSMAGNKGKIFGLGLLRKEKDREKFKKELRKLDMGLEDKLDTKVSNLSGGQRQGVAMIMSVITEPEILLLDEHTAALDPKSSQKVMEVTENIVKDRNLTTLMVTHNIDHALKYGNRLWMVHRGQIIFDIEGEEKEKIE